MDCQGGGTPLNRWSTEESMCPSLHWSRTEMVPVRKHSGIIINRAHKKRRSRECRRIASDAYTSVILIMKCFGTCNDHNGGHIAEGKFFVLLAQKKMINRVND